MAEKPIRAARPERPSRPERTRRPERDKLAEKYKRDDAKAQRKHKTPNPLADVEPIPDDAQASSELYHEAFQGSISNRMKAEDARRSLAIDSEFFIVVCFQHRVQKNVFLERAGWDGYGDKYLDGHYVAEKMGISLEGDGRPDDPLLDVPPYDTGERIDQSWLEFVDGELPDKQ